MCTYISVYCACSLQPRSRYLKPLQCKQTDYINTPNNILQHDILQTNKGKYWTQYV